MKKIIIILIIVFALFALVEVFIHYKDVLADRFKVFIERKLEHILNRKVRIGNLFISPNRIVFKDVVLFKKEDVDKPHITIKSLKIDFSLLSVIKSGKLLPLIYLENMAVHLEEKDPYKENFVANGTFTVSLKVGKNIPKMFTSLPSINNVRILNMHVFSPIGEVTNVTGDIYVEDVFLKVPELTFDYNNVPYNISMDFTKAARPKEYFFTLKASSEVVNLEADFEKAPGTIKITKLNGSFGNSSFGYTGEINQRLLPAVFSVHGQSSLDLEDLKLLSPRLEDLTKRPRPKGTVKSTVGIKGTLLGGPAEWDINISSRSDRIKIWDFKIDDVFFDLRAKAGRIETSLLKAYPYNGVLVSRIEANPAKKGVPYEIVLLLDNIDVSSLVQDTEWKNKNIYGKLRSQVELGGYAADINSMKGRGSIIIENANLGPAPLLMPLLGNLYGYVRKLIPELRKIDITRAAADFTVENRKIYADNIGLGGDIINISAYGYIDFDKNLDFTVKNEISRTAQAEGEDWKKSLMDFVATAGSFLGEARLTGTLKHPRWEFRYINGVSDLLKGGLEKIIKDIF